MDQGHRAKDFLSAKLALWNFRSDRVTIGRKTEARTKIDVKKETSQF
jgi:hypothetical protein